MSTNTLLTRCKQRAVRYLAMSTNFLLTPCKQGAVLSRYSIGLGNENKLRTHTLQSKVRYFHVTPLALGTKFPLKPGRAIGFQA